jgi:hypothetical protein
LTYNPVIVVDAKLLEASRGSFLRIQLDLSSGEEYRHLVYVNTCTDYSYPSDVFKNSTQTVYFIRNVTLNTWAFININAKSDYDAYFSDRNYNFGLSSVSVATSTCNGTINLLLKQVEINYECAPWSLAT